jgi:hypothetical protein
MRLSEETLNYINKVISVAKKVSIESLAITSEHIRGLDQDNSIFLFQETDIPTMEFEAVGISKGDDFVSRLSIVSGDTYHVDADIDNDNGVARNLIFKSSGKGSRTSVSYRCANPDHVQSPKRIKNKNVITEVILPDDTVQKLNLVGGAMGNQDIFFHGDEDGFHLSMLDDNNNSFKHTFSMEGNKDIFKHKYPLKILLTVLKLDSNCTFNLMENGMLHLTLEDITLYILPKL